MFTKSYRFSGRGPGPGTALLTAALLFVALRPAKGAEVVITVTGKLNGGNDYLGIFGMGTAMPAGTPYTLVYTFDDSKGRGIHPGNCPDGGSGIVGARQASPATAVLTINGKSYLFGRRPDARSSTWRAVATGCSESGIAIDIVEGQSPLESKVGTRLVPVQGMRSLTQDSDWKSPVSLSKFYAQNTFNGFVITRPNQYSGATQGYFSVSMVTISGPKQATAGAR